MRNFQITCRTDGLLLSLPESCPHTWSPTEALFVIELRVPEVPEDPGPHQSLACTRGSTTLLILTARSRILLEHLTGSQSRNSPYFMEAEGSLPRLQMLATCPYPEPYKSKPCPPSQFLKTQLNIILPSTPESSKWSLSFRFPHQSPVCKSLLPHTCYMLRPAHYRFDHPNNIW